MGINLSGGQKARVGLARAIYANKDILLLDDPVSALDNNVRKNVYNQVFQRLCKDKTRILCTHSLDFLPYCDHVVLMKEGRVET
jgi:ATP-binding cassette subfamily C (CFTR/MRP) protein 10